MEHCWRSTSRLATRMATISLVSFLAVSAPISVKQHHDCRFIVCRRHIREIGLQRRLPGTALERQRGASMTRWHSHASVSRCRSRSQASVSARSAGCLSSPLERPS
ncbi:hypothetical protein F442_19424 [Phytophthora nicotianae P10297]|uniref:Secreted protein n=2 Tax=Phytophthora nicotianae TaxID=4792 RepID=W2PM20_PHYN3|nr:hypothetical protein PPTG_24131 [Phytophthora nicotianae INRA-310]ETN01080.1 hypothetical protein PPTG_24131 [Phytophthora nicotianae INRA-310]ETP31734.1 hypothetical protein F442_19424 [Phytophthora nicotianae P10297]